MDIDVPQVPQVLQPQVPEVPQVPECVVCMEPTARLVILRCPSSTTHTLCAECARNLLALALKDHNVCGDCNYPCVHLSVSCPVCRHCTYDTPFTMCPPQFYTSLPRETTACTRCLATFESNQSAAEHIVFTCPQNKFLCGWCKMPVHWGRINAYEIAQRHVYSGECTGVCCGAKLHTGRACEYHGALNSAREHNRCHKVRSYITKKFSGFIESVSHEELSSVVDAVHCLIKEQNPLQLQELMLLTPVELGLSDDDESVCNIGSSSESESDNNDDDDDEEDDYDDN